MAQTALESAAPLGYAPASLPARRRRPSLDFSATGLVYCAMMMFMGLSAVNTQANLLFGVFGLMIGVLLVAWQISRLVLRRLEVRRVLPEHGVVGMPAAFAYEFTNAKRFWPSLSVTLSELDAAGAFVKPPCAYLLHAAPRTTATAPTEVVPRRRGLYALDRYQLQTGFPFGVIKRAADRRHRETIVVFPAIGRVDPKLLATLQSADRSGATMRPRRGGDDEFYGVKEFRAGENARNIYWRRSAKTGVLVSKEMTHVSPPKVMLLVDTHEPDGPDGVADVERAVAMAASLASQALEAGLMVGAYAWAGDGWLGVAPNRGKRHRRDVLAHLGQLPRNRTKETQAMLDASRDFLPSGASGVLVTPRDLQAGLSEQGRSGLVVLSSATPQGRRWFTFEAGVDFAHSAPWSDEGRR